MTRRWRQESEFGPGPRHALCRERRARFLWLAGQHRQHKRLSACGHDVAEALLKALGDDGKLDPSHATIAARARCHVDTVVEALKRLRLLGLVQWTRRLVRDALSKWRTEQTSNAYVLLTPAENPENCRRACDPEKPGGVRSILLKKVAQEAGRMVFEPAEGHEAARVALVRIAQERQQARNRAWLARRTLPSST